MLLPGQSLKGRPWSSRSHPIHLNQNRADKIVRLAGLEETEEYAEMEKCVDEYVHFSHRNKSKNKTLIL